MKTKKQPIESKNISPDTPIYFLDVTVENVRCFGERQTLDVSDEQGKPARWTIILGDNGTGKTTLLQCLVGFQIDNVFVYASDKRLTEDGSTLYTYGAPGGIFSILKRYDEERNGQSPAALPTIETSAFYAGRLDADTFEKIPGCRFLDGASAKIRHRDQIKNVVIYAYGASRRMGAGAIAESSISRLTHDNVGSLFYEDGRLINAEEWLLQAYLAYKRSQEEEEQDIQAYTEKRYERVKELLIYLLDDVEDIRIKPITKTQLKAVVEAKTPYGWVDMKNLSLGYRTCIAWIVDLASRLCDRYPESDNPLEKPAIVLVDEIDLHLHPKWQRTIIRYLTEIFKQTQFIVTAHSPLVVQAMPENANIVLLKREGNQVVIHNNQEQEIIYGWRLDDQLITSDLFDLPSARPPQFDELLQQREHILTQDQLSPQDEKELEKIGQQLSTLPIAESKEEQEAMALIRKAAALLKTQFGSENRNRTNEDFRCTRHTETFTNL